MRLSIVILCWNDRKVIGDCLTSIFDEGPANDYEVVVSDNGSSDGSIEFIRERFPQVHLLENGTNLGFAKGNNAGLQHCLGQYVLILNPDTIVHPGSLRRWLEFADRHPEAGAFGCRVLNPDGSFQNCARPFPTVWRGWLSALYLRSLAHVSNRFVADIYTGWDGLTEREIDWQSGCCVMFRSSVLQQLGGFDEQFFYHFEEVDLCRRIWNAGYRIRYTPDCTITHLGGQSVNRFPLRFELEKYRNRYRYFYKHFGPDGARKCRRIVLTWIRVRQIGWILAGLVAKTDGLSERLAMYRVTADWNKRLNPVRFVERGDEPQISDELTYQHS